jgi:hypothetical protein
MIKMLGRGLGIIMPPVCASMMYLVPLYHEATPSLCSQLVGVEMARRAACPGSLRVPVGVKMASGTRGVHTGKPDTVGMRVAWDGDDGRDVGRQTSSLAP